MTLHFSIPLAVTVTGALVHLLAPAKWAQLGLAAFGAGLFATLMGLR